MAAVDRVSYFDTEEGESVGIAVFRDPETHRLGCEYWGGLGPVERETEEPLLLHRHEMLVRALKHEKWDENAKIYHLAGFLGACALATPEEVQKTRDQIAEMTTGGDTNLGFQLLDAGLAYAKSLIRGCEGERELKDSELERILNQLELNLPFPLRDPIGLVETPLPESILRSPLPRDSAFCFQLGKGLEEKRMLIF